MEAIELRNDLLKALEENARQEAKTINDVLNEAVERYLRERQEAKLDQEIEAFEAMHSEIKDKYLGQWIAIHEQKVIDHDSDGSNLYRRIRAKYGRTSDLIRKVTEQPVEEVWLRTPSTGELVE